MRQLFSRSFDLALGVATALLIGSAAIDGTVAAKNVTTPPIEAAYSAEVVEPPAPLPLDPKAALVKDLARKGRHWRIDADNGQPAHVWVPANYDPATAHVVIY